MKWGYFFSTTIGKKSMVAASGIFLILFLVVHAGINACIFLNDGGETFNTVASFMSHNWIMRFLELGLFVFLIAHFVQAMIIERKNRAARPVKYHFSQPNKNSKWYSRYMAIFGILILLFLIMHLSQFFIGTKKALYFEGDPYHDLYGEMLEVFSHGWIVALYLVGLIALFWHLLQGFQSAFHTLGLSHKKYAPIIKMMGTWYSVIIILLFALMPLSMYFGWIS